MKAWDDFLLTQEKELGSTTVKRWLTPLKVTRFDACNLYLEAKDAFQVHWFEEHIRPLVLTKLLNKSNKRIKVHIAIAKKISESPEAVIAKPADHLKSNTSTHEDPLPTTPFQLSWDFIDNSLSFKNFIVSEENLVPYKLLSELVGYQDGSDKLVEPKIALGSFNPIFLSGPSGSGKTHLLMATANYFKTRGLRVLYSTAETFTEHVVSSIRSGQMQFFRQAYRNIDALFIDDVEVFSRKGATQEELFHTFNSLHLEGKQIILSSKISPNEMKEIEPRLISRFEWGIVLPLHVLQLEDLRLLLLQKTKSLNIKLSDKVVDYLLETFTSSSKALLKAVEALVLRLHLSTSTDKNIGNFSIERIQGLLSDLIKSEEQSVITPSKIIRSTAEFFGIRVDDILGKSQNKECAFPRQLAMYLCRKELKLPYMKIGDFFSRDHSTVMTSIKQIEKGSSSNPNISQALSAICKSLK